MVAHYYRVIDTQTNTIVANAITQLEQAHETVVHLSKDHPGVVFEIERYEDRRVGGWGLRSG